VIAVVRHPDDVPHDPVGAFLADRLTEPSPSAVRGRLRAIDLTPNGSSRAVSCISFPAPTIPLAPEITSEPRSAGAPNTWSTRSPAATGSWPFEKMSKTEPSPRVWSVDCLSEFVISTHLLP
jgi:hypothetical protein